MTAKEKELKHKVLRRNQQIRTLEAKLEHNQKILLFYYRERWLVFQATKDEPYKHQAATKMVAAVDIGKLQGIPAEEFEKARS